jgi:hypothetical protein
MGKMEDGSRKMNNELEPESYRVQVQNNKIMGLGKSMSQ